MKKVIADLGLPILKNGSPQYDPLQKGGNGGGYDPLPFNHLSRLPHAA